MNIRLEVTVDSRNVKKKWGMAWEWGKLERKNITVKMIRSGNGGRDLFREKKEGK